MAKFITRIELHKVHYDDESYTILHAAMANEGFTRTIKDEEGKLYKLPTAEYNKEGNFTRDDIFNSAYEAASTTKKTFWILVTQSAGRTFLLQEVKK